MDPSLRGADTKTVEFRSLCAAQLLGLSESALYCVSHQFTFTRWGNGSGIKTSELVRMKYLVYFSASIINPTYNRRWAISRSCKSICHDGAIILRHIVLLIPTHAPMQSEFSVVSTQDFIVFRIRLFLYKLLNKSSYRSLCT